MALMRAVAWHNVLARLGMSVPLVVVHDVGSLLAGIGRPESVSRGLGDRRLGEAWRELLVEFSDADVIRSPSSWKHRDEMGGIVLQHYVWCNDVLPLVCLMGSALKVSVLLPNILLLEITLIK